MEEFLKFILQTVDTMNYIFHKYVLLINLFFISKTFFVENKICNLGKIEMRSKGSYCKYN